MPWAFFSQPTALGRAFAGVVVEGGREIVPSLERHLPADGRASVSRQQRTLILIWPDGVEKSDEKRRLMKARRLRRGHPGLSGSAEGSTNPTMSWDAVVSVKEGRAESERTSYSEEDAFAAGRRMKKGGSDGKVPSCL